MGPDPVSVRVLDGDEPVSIALTQLVAHMSGYSLYESAEAIWNSAEAAHDLILVQSGASLRPPELRDPNIGYLAKTVDLNARHHEFARLIEPTSAGETPPRAEPCVRRRRSCDPVRKRATRQFYRA
ncbi:hypothetical protein [Leifsonia poae]|uniref:hypothetical protein n=1 Tax=Leifsonia poae TaxID=110933 RepID=UPI003D668ADC